MKTLSFISSILITLSMSTYASSALNEKLYNNYLNDLQHGSMSTQSYSGAVLNESIYLDALWDASEEGIDVKLETSLNRLRLSSDRDIAKAFVLAHRKRDFVTAKKYYKVIIKKVNNYKFKPAGLYILWAYKEELGKTYKTLYKTAKDNFFDEYHYFVIVNKFMAKPTAEIKGLLTDNREFQTEYLKSYNNSPKLFLLCRHSRDYPCLFVMKNNEGEFLKHGEDIWFLPALAHGRGELKFHTTNGYTPQGIHTMDSVMPEANRPVAFGKYRRVILNFLPKTSGNEVEQDALNFDARFSTWWHEANISREVDRKFLRIHGTGRINDEPDLSYYPHITSSGCITVREGRYPENTYYDQRVMLDALMRASDLDEVFVNEEKIKGLLYVVEIDDEKRAVTRNDLKKYGI